MSFSFLNPRAKKRDHIVAIDLGYRSTKGVLLEYREDHYCLTRYTVLDTPTPGKPLENEALSAHIKAVYTALEPKTKQVILSIGPSDSILRNTEFPLMPVEEMRQMLKLNTKNYLQQDLPDHVFDCFIVPPAGLVATKEHPKSIPPTKYKVWVGGMKRQTLSRFENAIKMAGLVPDQITLSLLGPSNAFELAPPIKEAIALVDLGYKSSNISIIANGELCLNRVVETGGNNITNSLAEAMGISYAEAEGIKIGMPTEVDANLQPLLAPLGRDFRASIDFFEHHQDQPVSQVFLSGGASRSDYFIQSLQTELMVPCKSWNPVASLDVALSPQQTEDLALNGPLLTEAIGAAAGVF